MRRAARDTGLAAAFFAVAALACLAATGLFGPPDPGLTAERSLAIAVALIVPALAEEAAFRGPLLWPPLARPGWAALLVAAYVGWHPLAARLRAPGLLPLMSDPAFLALTALMGALAAILVLRHRRLWPAVLLHWAAVAGWIAIWGGP